MTNPLVTVIVSQQIAPTPNNLQGTGAFISQGGTNTAPGTQTLLTELSDLTPVLNGAKAITSITVSGGTATVTTTSPHGFTTSDTLLLTIAGATVAAFNGTFLCTVTGASAFTYVTTATGSATGTLVYTPEDVAELLAMATTFFAQGSYVPVYILECGPGNGTDGATFLTAWITANPGIYYSYLVPRTWDGNSTFLTLIASNESTTSKTYFYITTSLATWRVYTNLMKCVNALIEAPVYGIWPANALTAISWSGNIVTATTTAAHGIVPGNYFSIFGVTSSIVPTGYNGTFLALSGTTGSTIVYALAVNPGTESVLGTVVASYYSSAGVPSTEFSQAAAFWQSLSNPQPSSTNKVRPFARRYVSGVTPFPPRGNSALLTALKSANISVIGTGAQGGINKTLLLWGNMLDGRPWNYWWSADYAQINLALNVSNAVINGSNTPSNPLYNNQAGITALEGVCASTMTTMITVGLALGRVVQTQLDGPSYSAALAAGAFAGSAAVNAVPFAAYYAINESQYALGQYDGFSVIYAPLRGFDHITVNLIVTDFVAGP